MHPLISLLMDQEEFRALLFGVGALCFYVVHHVKYAPKIEKTTVLGRGIHFISIIGE